LHAINKYSDILAAPTSVVTASPFNSDGGQMIMWGIEPGEEMSQIVDDESSEFVDWNGENDENE
jgi:hypothetical protein